MTKRKTAPKKATTTVESKIDLSTLETFAFLSTILIFVLGLLGLLFIDGLEAKLVKLNEHAYSIKSNTTRIEDGVRDIDWELAHLRRRSEKAKK